jgi:NSS family neurotransmitter:Na+ symporter
MGTFVAFVTAAITFYYTVVTGWCLKYFFATCFQGLIKKDSMGFWATFTSSWEPIVFHFIAIFIGCSIIIFGVVKGIERANRILIPSLFILLLIAGIRALTLPGALKGLDFLFTPNLSLLADHKLWLQALSQSAWSNGAGWGLILTYAVYTHQKKNPVLTSATLGLGNSLASILAAITIIPTVFAFFHAQSLAQGTAVEVNQVIDVMKSGNEGLTFIWIPNLFAQIPGGTLFLAFFFLALCFAAFSSLISQLELITRVFMDTGMRRKKAVTIVGASCFVLGLPSAIFMGFFNNQDWVWGLGLMISGSFFIILVLKVGPTLFREKIVAVTKGKLKLGRGFDFLVKFFLPVQILAMLGWWFWDSYSNNPGSWLNPFHKSSVGTVLFQWGVAVCIFILFNKMITKKVEFEDHVD